MKNFDEKSSTSINAANFQGGLDCKNDTRKDGQRRRVLGAINQNLVEGQVYPLVKKRVLSEKNVVYEKKQADPVHRPITRRFAAQNATTLKSSAEETKTVSTSSGFGECIYVDDEHKPVDQPVPMSLEQTESMQSEIDQEEIEMEDIMEEPVLDIDTCDANNPLAAVDYVEDLHTYYKKMENTALVSPSYMAKQGNINERMRAILIDWLIEVHDKYDLMQESLFLTVNLIDRFLEKQTVIRKKLQLVGLVATLLACKYEEVSVPVVSDLILISDKAYTRNEILEMEKLMVNTLQFNISVPTAYVFIRRFLKAAQADKKLELLAFFLIELSLVEYEMLKYSPSLLAAAAVYTAQCAIYGVKQWSKTCEWHTNYSEGELFECSSLMVGFHQKAGTGKLTGAYRKYCTFKYNYTAKCEPAHFLLEN